MRLSLRTSATVIAGTAILALAANGVTYAATGQGLVGGHQNVAGKTTTLKTSSPGPALSLVSRGDKRPSLSVSSKAKVKNLNASLLDGRSASSLATHAQTFLAGQPGTTLDDTAAFRFPVKPGAYVISLQGAFEPVQETETGIVECFVTDQHFTRIYVGATSAIDPDAGIPLPAAANVVRVARGAHLLSGCFASAPVTFLQPLTVSLTRVDSQSVKRAPEIHVSAMKHALGPRV
ncbi:MAG TPA: hypothetical protein VLK34_03130 [Nocardioidaceae bacterium]|nr:hypothetical protein [Nocardioidaceae bacterium]